MKAVGKKPLPSANTPSTPSKALDGSSYRKGMFLAFLDDALTQRYKVRSIGHESVASRVLMYFYRSPTGQQ